MKEKKLWATFILFSFITMLSICGSVQAQKAGNDNIMLKSYNEESDLIKSSYDDQIMLDSSEVSEPLKKGCVVVKVKTVCDQKYRSKHSKDWKVRAKNTVRDAAKILYSKFNIKYYPSNGIAWTSPNTSDWESIYKNAVSNFKVTKSGNMLVAFSGQRVGGVAGMSKQGKKNGPHLVVFSTTYKSEVETTQHEMAHTYNLGHCTSACVMQNVGFGYTNKFCSKHENYWNKNRKFY